MEEKISIKPYNREETSKKEEVSEMFNNISAEYDFLNHFMSMGIDAIWRRKAINILKRYEPKKIIDLAAGTGDFSLAATRLHPDRIIGVDISDGMLEMGRKKIKKKKKDHIITLVNGDSENLQFEDNEFDALTVGFGVRNYENLEKGLAEMLRVLKPGGKAIILEFSKPKKFPFKQFFDFYLKVMIPFFGKIFSKDSRAYVYLPESMRIFPEGEDFLAILEKVGYNEVRATPVSGGIATIYEGMK